MTKKYALVTGGAQRIGKAIVETLHDAGFDVFLHFGNSEAEALNIQKELNAAREDSCHIFSADLACQSSSIAEWVLSKTNKLDVLVNNASQFFSTPWESASANQWDLLFNTNCKAPFEITQALLPALKQANGCVINLIDIHTERTLENHPIYCASKAALKSLTLSLAKDHGKDIRCNGISPGAILWPDNEEEMSDSVKQEILAKVPMQRLGSVKNIAQTALLLVENDYINGQIINVDGGRTVFS